MKNFLESRAIHAMYKTSNDRRFRKNKAIIRRAYIDLTLEKGLGHVTVSDIAKRADINRMTFYSHYETEDDVLQEFVDDMVADITSYTMAHPTADGFFEIMNQTMYAEIDFFRLVAQEGQYTSMRTAFRKAIKKILEDAFGSRLGQSDGEIHMRSDLLSALIAYAYFDWLHGDYGDVPLDDVMKVLKEMVGTQIQ